LDKNTSYLKDKSTISTPKGKFAYFFLSKHSKYQNITECNIKNHLQNVLSKWHWPEGPPPAPPPSWARKEFCVVVCAALLTFVCMLRYSEWNVVPIWFLYSSVLMVVRWADLVPVFFDTYRNILYQSDISGQDAQSASIPRMFFPVGWKRQPEEGGIGPGCCGGGVITTWATGDGVIAAGSAV